MTSTDGINSPEILPWATLHPLYVSCIRLSLVPAALKRNVSPGVQLAASQDVLSKVPASTPYRCHDCPDSQWGSQVGIPLMHSPTDRYTRARFLLH